jgi:Zn-dependent protease with chaperone function
LHARSDSPDTRESHRLVFGLEITLGLVGLIGAASAVATAAASVHRAHGGANAVVVLGGHFTYPAVNVAAVLLLLLAGLGAAVIATVALACWRQLRVHRLFARAIPIVGPLPGHPHVMVIADSVPQAFCAGFLRPRIYVSQGALDLLEPDELAAVLLHEQHHRRARDPLRIACAGILSQALFFLPALRPLGERYSELAEQRADDAAVAAAGGERQALASALLAFDETAPAGSAGISPERVDALLGVAGRKRLPLALIAISAALLALLVVLVWRASAVASAHATFNLPVLSSQPCMLVLALLPVAACLGGIGGRRLVRAGAPNSAAG